MQMLNSLDQLQLWLATNINAWIAARCDCLELRQRIRDDVMPHYPQFYSWSNRVDENNFQVEIFDRSDGRTALLKLEFLLPQPTKNRP